MRCAAQEPQTEQKLSIIDMYKCGVEERLACQTPVMQKSPSERTHPYNKQSAKLVQTMTIL